MRADVLSRWAFTVGPDRTHDVSQARDAADPVVRVHTMLIVYREILAVISARKPSKRRRVDVSEEP